MRMCVLPSSACLCAVALAMLLAASRIVAEEPAVPSLPPAAGVPDQAESAAAPVGGQTGGNTEAASSDPVPVAAPDDGWGALGILGKSVEKGERRHFFLLASESFAGASMRTPVVILRGATAGPTVCFTAGIHGDELNGVEIVRELVEALDPGTLRGTVIGVPIVNLHGFQRSSRYLPDRRDLNRYFPGDPHGSSASRIADALFHGIITECDALVDFHSGSLHRSNMPQVRGDLTDPSVRNLAYGFGAEVVVHNPGKPGTLRRAATDAGIPAIIYEAGEPMRFQKKQIERGVDGVRSLLRSLGVLNDREAKKRKQQFYYQSHWVRADRGGILVSSVELGDHVREGDILGTVADPLRRGRMVIVSPHTGRLIGMTLAPVVIPGDAAFHIGVQNGEPPEVADGAGAPEQMEDEDERPE